MRRIPVLKNFDPTQPIGYLLLTEDAYAELLPNQEFVMAYTVTAQYPTKIHVHEIGLVPHWQETNSPDYAQKTSQTR